MLNQSNLAEQSFEFSSIAAMPAVTPGYNRSPQSAYKQTAAETASPEKLVIMLYKGATRFLHQGEKALLEDRYEDANESLTRALDIVAELNVTLNMEAGDIAVTLRGLYNFYLQEIISANVKHDASLLQPVITFFEDFSKVWSDAASQL
ncbi:MAG: flagellar export chaperone FliS [Peptococcaceae bacterium]|nr:flagellar export chaperone FliS [Peptococcaceae bacterium]